MFKLEIKPAETLHTKLGNAKIDVHGYYTITSSKEGNNRKRLHRLIFEDFYGPIPEGYNIHHKNGDKTNNCIMNLQLLTASEHHSLHNKGEKNPMFGKTRPTNTSGYYRVYKHKNSQTKQGFTWEYKYPIKGRQKSIVSVDFDKLKDKVLAKGLPWFKL